MQTSFFLAQVIGPVLFVIGLSCLLNHKNFNKIFGEMKKNQLFMFFSSCVSLGAGIALFLGVKQLQNPGEIVLAILALIAIIKSIIFLIFPEYINNIFKKPKKFEKYLPISGVFYILTGAYLSYFGYSVYL